ncbi:MAG: Cof-type HAD-IIB family hydrolase [Propionicimonas sp.]
MSRTRLIAADLDGTMLRHDKSISPRTISAIRAAQQQGVRVVAATGRQATSLPDLLAPTGVRYAVASNGAIGVDLNSGSLLFEELLSAEVAAEIVAYLTAELTNPCFSVVRDHGDSNLAGPGYLELAGSDAAAPWQLTFKLTDATDLVSRPTLKLRVRHPRVGPEEMLSVLASSSLTGFVATTSGAQFLEIQGAGVTKASGLAKLCAHLGVERDEVMAIGDARNDIDMITWAGLGVAMGNAVPDAIAAARWSTAGNDQDGLALAIERRLALAIERRLGLAIESGLGLAIESRLGLDPLQTEPGRA